MAIQMFPLPKTYAAMAWVGDLTEDEVDASMAVVLFPTVQGQGTEPLLPQLEVTLKMGEPLPW